MITSHQDMTSLTVSERIQMAEDLWDSVRDAPEVLELTEAQRKELDRRVAAHNADPGSAIPWATLRQELLGGR